MSTIIPQAHSFHIPVMGLGYTIDTPLKVARFGISSVVSIIEDHLVERMREIHCHKEGLPYDPIPVSDMDHRAKRITAYLDMLQEIVRRQMTTLKAEPFEEGRDIVKYFELLPEDSDLKRQFRDLESMNGPAKAIAQDRLRTLIVPGAIDVNIMTKLDRPNYNSTGEMLPVEYCDAMAALRGFALSKGTDSMVFSAGLNPRLYGYCASFPDFLPDADGNLRKKVILKVSDHRSALIQGKYLAKKGIWVSEFRIESGLNCGGHAFATDGLLLGPILEEFKAQSIALAEELYGICNAALSVAGKPTFTSYPVLRITVQGGIGTAREQEFLLKHYGMVATGWGSPFLLVPEATNVDDATLQLLATARKEDYFLSDASPLGVAFNDLRTSSSNIQRMARIDKKRPGSPCYKEFLASNTEFTKEPICTASRKYQKLKIDQLLEQGLSLEQYNAEIERITAKDCLCEGLGAAALLKNHEAPAHKLTAVTVCPGPNLAYFSGTWTLREMIDHIYGRREILNKVPRSHMFINELQLYLDHFKKEIAQRMNSAKAGAEKHLHGYKQNLLDGIGYYRSILPLLKSESAQFLERMKAELDEAEGVIAQLAIAIGQVPAHPAS
ncbi:MAG: hypothetical protein IPP33_07630 [Flavobacteriales bacterium]|nr:hypothetical protein [Flavobacteriales bacterium]